VAETTRDYLDRYLPLVEIVGWSTNGAVAYRHITTGSEAGSRDYHFVIFNAVNDETMQDDILRMYHRYDEIQDELSKGYKAKWNMLLKMYDIIGYIDDPFKDISQHNFNTFPVNDFDCWFDYTIEKNKDDFANVIDWKLIMGNNNVKKIISHATERGYYDIHGRKILGYYKSPYENRLAIFVSSSIRYYPYLEVLLYGCNMDTGLSEH
jgi:hypothetical protein